MNSSVETRYPFLDEEVFSYLAGLHPRWKMRGLRDKYILRLHGRSLGAEVDRLAAQGDVPGPDGRLPHRRLPTFVDQLLSPESLARTGYFDVQR